MQRYQTRSRFDAKSIAVLDIETISGEEMEDGGFPPWPTHFPVVASVLTADRDAHNQWAFAIESVRFGEDADPLQRIDELIRGRSVISFNGRGFDFPVLMLTAQASRHFNLPALTATAIEPRYESAKHYDLADQYSGFGAARGGSLERLCTALQIPAKATTHGDEVGQLYDRGEVEKIVDYCETDVAATLLLFAHHRAMTTSDPGYHASLTYQFVRWVQKQGCDHLAPFAKVDNLDDLLRQSLLGQIDAAIENAGLNADWHRKQAIDASFGPAVTY